VIVVDETINMAWLVDKTVNFFKHESCGKCTPCREGTYWLKHLLRRLTQDELQAEEVDKIYSVAKGIQGKCLCALGEFAAGAVVTGMERFRDDFDQHAMNGHE
jgi:NADH-quinone oxidoreductase subunit F